MLKKIGFGAGFWAVMFLAVSALMVTTLPSIWQKVLEIVIAGVAAYILAMIYFRKSPAGIKEGVALFITWFIVSGILDLLITIQYVRGVASYMEGLKLFYGMESFWISLALALVGVLVAAKLASGRSGSTMQQPPMSQPRI